MSLRPNRAEATIAARTNFAWKFAGASLEKLKDTIELDNTYISLATFVEKSDKFHVWIRITPQGTILVEGKEKEAPIKKETGPDVYDRTHLLYEYYKTKASQSVKKQTTENLDEISDEAIKKGFEEESLREKREPVQEIVRLFDKSDFGLLTLDLTRLNPERFNLEKLSNEKEQIISHLVKENSAAILSAISGLTGGRYIRKEITDLASKKGFFVEGIFYKKIEAIQDLSNYEMTKQFDLKTLKTILLEEPNSREAIAEKIQTYTGVKIKNPETFVLHIGGERASVLEKYPTLL